MATGPGSMFSKLRFRTIGHMKCRVSWMKFCNFSNPIFVSFLRKDFCKFSNFRTMSEDGEYVGGRAGGVTFDPTPPLVPLDAGPGHQVQGRNSPSGLCLARPGRRGGATACRCPPHPQVPAHPGPGGDGGGAEPQAPQHGC